MGVVCCVIVRTRAMRANAYVLGANCTSSKLPTILRSMHKKENINLVNNNKNSKQQNFVYKRFCPDTFAMNRKFSMARRYVVQSYRCTALQRNWTKCHMRTSTLHHFAGKTRTYGIHCVFPSMHVVVVFFSWIRTMVSVTCIQPKSKGKQLGKKHTHNLCCSSSVHGTCHSTLHSSPIATAPVVVYSTCNAFCLCSLTHIGRSHFMRFNV